jgi:hypothetical protein
VKLVRVLAVMGSLTLVLVSLGCGGSSDNSAEPTTTATTSSGGNERLSESSWATYESEAAKAKTVNDAAIKTFRKCRVVAGNGASSSEVQTCLGNSMSSVVTEGQKLLDELNSLAGETSGACATALNTLNGNVKLYIASVNTLESSVKGKGVGGHASFPAQLDNTQQILVRTRASVPPVEAACKPVT